MFVAVRPQLQCVFFYSCKGLSINGVAIFEREGSKIKRKHMTKMQKSVVIDEEGVYRSGRSDDIIYEKPQEQQQAGVVLGVVHKVRQHF